MKWTCWKILGFVFQWTAVVMFLFAACKPVKKVQKIEEAIRKKDTATTVVVVVPEKPEIDSNAIVQELLDKVVHNTIHFQTFSAKTKVSFNSKDGSDQARADLRIKKDSLIWISLTGALGVEGYRVIITRDSVVLMNKLDKTVEFRRIDYLSELTQIPFDFYTIQDLIIGNPIFVDSNVVSYKAGAKELNILTVGQLFKHLLTIENGTNRITHSKLDDVDPIRNRTCDVTYNNFEKNALGFDFSTFRKVSVSEKAKLDVEVEFKQYNFNQPLTFPFAIPKNFKRR